MMISYFFNYGILIKEMFDFFELWIYFFFFLNLKMRERNWITLRIIFEMNQVYDSLIKLISLNWYNLI